MALSFQERTHDIALKILRVSLLCWQVSVGFIGRAAGACHRAQDPAGEPAVLLNLGCVHSLSSWGVCTHDIAQDPAAKLLLLLSLHGKQLVVLLPTDLSSLEPFTYVLPPTDTQALWISLDRDEAELADPFDLDSPENPSFMAWCV